MKKTKLLIGLLVVLGIAVVLFLATRGSEKSTITNTDKDFAVKNTDDIEQVFIADRNGKTITLAREKKGWIIAETQQKARSGAMQTLLETIKKMSVRYVPTQASVPNIVNELATIGLKVEIFGKENKKIRSFYIGGVTPDERGTYMIMEGSNNPYVMHLPSWEGGLRGRFFLDRNDWRDRTLFQEDVENIKNVTITYNTSKDKSFSVTHQGKRFEVVPADPQMPKNPTEAKKGYAEAYLTNFKSLIAEAFEEPSAMRDSIVQKSTFCVIEMTKQDGSVQKLSLHPIPSLDIYGDLVRNEQGLPVIERYFAVDEKKDCYLIQHGVFEKILWSYQSFF